MQLSGLPGALRLCKGNREESVAQPRPCTARPWRHRRPEPGIHPACSTAWLPEAHEAGLCAPHTGVVFCKAEGAGLLPSGAAACDSVHSRLPAVTPIRGLAEVVSVLSQSPPDLLTQVDSALIRCMSVPTQSFQCPHPDPGLGSKQRPVTVLSG